MKVNDLLNVAKEELREELLGRKKEQLKKRLREIKAAELTLGRLRNQLETFLEQDADDAVFDD